MLDYQTIPKDPPTQLTLNWQKLREKGIRHLEELGSAIWTDFNVHDPGITILEVLCYAITDLGYRTDFPLEDLLAYPTMEDLSADPTLKNPCDRQDASDFFHAVEILPNHPVTEIDIRKIFIDTFVALQDFITFDEGLRGKCDPAGRLAKKRVIKNAWISPGEVSKPKIYHCNRYRFSEAVYEKIQKLLIDLMHRKEIHVNFVFEELIAEGLDAYKATLKQVAENTTEILKSIWQFAEFTNTVIVYIPEDENGSTTFVKSRPYTITDILTVINQFIEKEMGYPLSEKELQQIEKLLFQDSSLSFESPKHSELHLTFDNPGAEKFKKLLSDPRTMQDRGTTLAEICPINIRGLNEVVIDLIEEIDPRDIDTVNGILKAAIAKFHGNRSLAEDLFQVSFVGKQPIGICAEVEISPDVDKEEVEAEIYHSVQEFLTPTINFYSLRELEEEGYSCDEIFDGPLLENGFLKSEDLEKSQLREVVNESDLVQVIMDVPGVMAVRFLQVFNCKGEKIQREGIRNWCLKMPKNHKPVLEVNCSEIKFKIGNIFTKANPEEVKERLLLLNKIKKKPMPEPSNLQPVLPRGRYRDLHKYYSIQHLFPPTYHVGREGVPPSYPAKRKAQAKQLKGYLLFFDQLLANYLEQLRSVKCLLSIQQDISQPTYLERVLTEKEIPGIDELYLWDETDEGKTFPQLEDDFKMRSRRNQILDHLLARFGEKFTDYAMMVLNSASDEENELPPHKFKALDEVLAEKASFLLTLPQLGSERGKGFNYKAIKCGVPDVWTARPEKISRVASHQESDSATSTDPNDEAVAEDSSPDPITTNPTDEDLIGGGKVDKDLIGGGKVSADMDFNISGLKKRVCKFLGLKNCQRSRLSSVPKYKVKIDPVIVSGEVQYYKIWLVSSETNKRLLEGTKQFRLRREAKAAARELFNEALKVHNYYFIFNKKVYQAIGDLEVADNIKEIQVILKSFNGTIIAQSKPLNKEGALALREEIRGLSFPAGMGGDTGFHLIEHILLRPGDRDAYELLQPFRLAESCLAADPYSFWVTIIAPAWHDRFQNKNARFSFEQVVRREAPAHIGLRFLYLDNMQMVEFELPYKNWLEEKAKEKPNERMLTNHQNKVVQILNQYKDEFTDLSDLGRTQLACQEYLDRPLQKFE